VVWGWMAAMPAFAKLQWGHETSFGVIFAGRVVSTVLLNWSQSADGARSSLFNTASPISKKSWG
jgi:hypothetical protein